MGNSTSIDNCPMAFATFVQHAKEPMPFNNNNSCGFKNNLKMWSVYDAQQPELQDETVIEPFSLIEQNNDTTLFQRNRSYLILLLHRNFANAGNNQIVSTPMLITGLASHKKKEPLSKCTTNATESLSPRGLEYVFASNELFNSLSTASTSTTTSFSLYVWNGKETSEKVQASALNYAFTLEQVLTSNPTGAEHLFDFGGPVHLAQYLQDDVPLQLKKSMQSKLHLLSHFVEAHLEDAHSLGSLLNINSARGNRKVSSSTAPPAAHQRTGSASTPAVTIPGFAKSLLTIPVSSGAASSSSNDDSARHEQSKSNASSIPPASPATKQPAVFKLPQKSQGESARNKPVFGLPIPSLSGALNKQHSERGSKQPDSSGTQSSSRESSFSSSARLDSSARTPSSHNEDVYSLLHGPRHKHGLAGAMDPNISAAQKMQYYRKILSRMGRSHVYLGGDWIARNKEELKKNKITHIVNVASCICGVYFPDDFKYLCVPLYDSGEESIIGIFFTVIDYIETALHSGGRVYVHCFEGVSRSVSMVISYFMYCLFKQKQTVSANQVLEKVKSQREVASPNAGFIVQLIQWEKMLNNSATYMFRVAPLNDRYFEHGETYAKLCNSRELDSRTCFVLWSAKAKAIYFYIGSKCNEAFTKQGENFVRILKQYYADKIAGTDVPVYTAYENAATAPTPLVDNGNNDQHLAAFKQLLESVEVNNLLSDANKAYKDLDYSDKQPSKSGTMSTPRAPEEKKPEENEPAYEPADMWQYFADDDEFEYLEKFDSGDLWDDGLYILKPAKEALYHQVYVWIGDSFELNDKTSEEVCSEIVDKFMKQEKLNRSEWNITYVKQGKEPETFWTFFEDG